MNAAMMSFGMIILLFLGYYLTIGRHKGRTVQILDKTIGASLSAAAINALNSDCIEINWNPVKKNGKLNDPPSEWKSVDGNGIGKYWEKPKSGRPFYQNTANNKWKLQQTTNMCHDGTNKRWEIIDTSKLDDIQYCPSEPDKYWPWLRYFDLDQQGNPPSYKWKDRTGTDMEQVRIFESDGCYHSHRYDDLNGRTVQISDTNAAYINALDSECIEISWNSVNKDGILNDPPSEWKSVDGNGIGKYWIKPTSQRPFYQNTANNKWKFGHTTNKRWKIVDTSRLEYSLEPDKYWLRYFDLDQQSDKWKNRTGTDMEQVRIFKSEGCYHNDRSEYLQ